MVSRYTHGSLPFTIACVSKHRYVVKINFVFLVGPQPSATSSGNVEWDFRFCRVGFSNVEKFQIRTFKNADFLDPASWAIFLFEFPEIWVIDGWMDVLQFLQQQRDGGEELV